MENNFDPWIGYGRSKLANILFTLELAKRLEGEKCFKEPINLKYLKSDSKLFIY